MLHHWSKGMAAGDSDEEGELLSGMLSPPGGYPLEQAHSQATSLSQAAFAQVQLLKPPLLRPAHTRQAMYGGA